MFERRNEMANAKNNWEHPVCPVCSEICYLIDKVSFDGVIYHKQCLKCYECKRSLHASNCVRVRDHVYCTYHGGNLLRRRSMLIGPEANRPKPGRRRPPSSSRRKGGRGHSGGYRNATSPTSPPNNPFRLLNREMSSLEQRFKETEDVMRQSFRSKGISIDRRDASGSRGSGSTAHFPIRT
ncbi:hypothetical protein IWQ62_004043 [Dispira parvispora]|uniref:LIM zinc-binding domain-containing protein n=1 Tax=Dispira parvispora TaxID=1520584 RepID=A0A9W8APT2_9FUNG|nr:hypothetical protein IWQ62_004043 [Dispira parvispora]